MRSNAKTVDEYLAELPPDRREALKAVRAVILKNLPKGYEEGMHYGAIGYCVPHSVYPPGYHCDPKQPLPLAELASQKNYLTRSLLIRMARGSLRSLRERFRPHSPRLARPSGGCTR